MKTEAGRVQWAKESVVADSRPREDELVLASSGRAGCNDSTEELSQGRQNINHHLEIRPMLSVAREWPF
jgi:hypothetical protein